MTSLHQNWHATDDADERRVRITATPSSKSQSHSKAGSPVSNLRSQAVPQAKRRPAAIVGVLLCIIAGVAAFQGFNFSDSRGQVDSSTVTVRLRSTGADPVTINATPGMTITWTNDDTIPHVLTSDTLPTSDGKPFVTSAIFPGSSTHILIPLTAAEGAYPYISKTAEIVSGQIIIRAASASVTPTPSSVPAYTAPVTQAPAPVVEQPVVTEPAPFPVDTTPAFEDTSLTAEVSNSLPINPHTVGSGEVPLPDRQVSGVPAVTQHKPLTQTESGPEVWIVVFAAISALLFVTRKAFRTV